MRETQLEIINHWRQKDCLNKINRHFKADRGEQTNHILMCVCVCVEEEEEVWHFNRINRKEPTTLE